MSAKITTTNQLTPARNRSVVVIDVVGISIGIISRF